MLTTNLIPTKPAALFDLTGTLVKSQIAFDWGAHLVGKKLLDENMYRCVLAWRENYKAGALTYNEMTKNCITDFYQGLDKVARDDLIAETEKFVVETDMRRYLYRTSRQIYDVVRENYERTIAVTGLPEELGIALKNVFPFAVVLGSQPDLVEGKRYVGRKPGVNVARLGMKEEIVMKYAEADPIDWKCSFAAGNTEQDFSMLRLVSGHYEKDPIKIFTYCKIALLFNAKPELRNIAQENGWFLVDSDAVNPKYNIQKVQRALQKLNSS